MSSEANKNILRHYFRAMGQGRVDELEKLVSKDVHWWIAGAGDIDFKMIKGLWTLMFTPPPGPDAMEIISMTAEGDRVATELVSHLLTPDGRDYNNRYHMLFIIRDGKIAKVREYLDTAYTENLFGVPARWPGSEPDLTGKAG